jgi:predicted  nucleic acid-binding Zn-ribbon protein
LADDSTRSALSSELQELKRTRNEIAEQIQHLQQKLSQVDENIATREPELQCLDDDRQKQEEAVESRLAELRDRKARLTLGIDSLDRAVIASIDAVRQQALDSLLSFLQ